MTKLTRAYFHGIRALGFHTLEYLGPLGGNPALNVVFNNIVPEPEPEMASMVRAEIWNKKLESKQAGILAQNPGASLSIRHDPSTGSDSLYEKLDGRESRIMFDGHDTNTTLATDKPYTIENGTIRINNFQIPYSRWIACLEQGYTEAYRNAGMELPHAGMGISTLIIPSDYQIALTMRGDRTPIYPNRLYCPGGGLKPGLDTAQAAIDEIVDETGLVEGVHFDANGLTTVAFVADTNHMGTVHSRPEILAVLNTAPGISSADITSAYADHVRRKGKEPDVSNIEYFPSGSVDATENNLRLYGRQMCPPTAASFAYLLYLQLLAGEDSEEKAFCRLEGILQTLPPV